MNIRLGFIMIVLFNVVACNAKLSKEESILQLIIKSHFNDAKVFEDLKPLIDYKEWTKGRMKTVKHGNGKILTIPPPPSRDTVIYGFNLFDQLHRDGKLTLEESKDLGKINQSSGYISIGKIRSSYESKLRILSRLELIHKDQTHYHISEPLFNKERTKVVLTVDRNSRGGSYGEKYLFQLIENNWVIKYQRLYQIE